jgi:hypothetical protein
MKLTPDNLHLFVFAYLGIGVVILTGFFLYKIFRRKSIYPIGEEALVVFAWPVILLMGAIATPFFLSVGIAGLVKRIIR